MNWYMGQKVICVIDEWDSPTAPFVFAPGKNEIVTVKEIYNNGSVDLFVLNEYEFHPADGTPCSYHTLYFRPLESTYTEEEIEEVNIDELVQPELEPA